MINYQYNIEISDCASRRDIVPFILYNKAGDVLLYVVIKTT